jgi:hypothetical protein
VVVVVHSHPHNVNSEVPDAPQITVNNKMAKTSKNSAKVGRRRSNATAKKVATKKLAAKPARAKPKLLAGGNPQIAKADGDAPSRPTSPPCLAGNRASAAASTRSSSAPSPMCARNSPLYGVEGQVRGGDGGWFLGIHCYTKFIKVAFFRGTSLRPIPPGESKQEEVRYLNIHQHDKLDEAQFAAWVKQASQLPGERM